MSEKEKTFPAPRARPSAEPYRQAAPPAPSAPVDLVVAQRPIEKPLDVFDELEHVQIDPRALEEARSSNRAWGGAAVAAGAVIIAFSLALDFSMWNSSFSHSRFMFIPSIGVVLVVYGVRRWRMRGIEY